MQINYKTGKRELLLDWHPCLEVNVDWFRESIHMATMSCESFLIPTENESADADSSLAKSENIPPWEWVLSHGAAPHRVLTISTAIKTKATTATATPIKSPTLHSLHSEDVSPQETNTRIRTGTIQIKRNHATFPPTLRTQSLSHQFGIDPQLLTIKSATFYCSLVLLPHPLPFHNSLQSNKSPRPWHGTLSIQKPRSCHPHISPRLGFPILPCKSNETSTFNHNTSQNNEKI